MSKVIHTAQYGKYTVDDYEWEPTPRWRQFFGAKPFRQWHAIFPDIHGPGGYFTYADAAQVEGDPA